MTYITFKNNVYHNYIMSSCVGTILTSIIQIKNLDFWYLGVIFAGTVSSYIFLLKTKDILDSKLKNTIFYYLYVIFSIFFLTSSLTFFFGYRNYSSMVLTGVWAFILMNLIARTRYLYLISSRINLFLIVSILSWIMTIFRYFYIDDQDIILYIISMLYLTALAIVNSLIENSLILNIHSNLQQDIENINKGLDEASEKIKSNLHNIFAEYISTSINIKKIEISNTAYENHSRVIASYLNLDLCRIALSVFSRLYVLILNKG